jgi:hypothetical protein
MLLLLILSSFGNNSAKNCFLDNYFCFLSINHGQNLIFVNFRCFKWVPLRKLLLKLFGFG